METQVLVVGAGPYGVGIAQALWERGLGVVVVGKPFELWYRHTLDAMDLRSDLNASEIYSRDGRYRLADFARAHGEAPLPARLPVAVYRRYLRWVEGRLPFTLEATRVETLERIDDHFVAELDDGRRITASAVVVATGLGGHQHFPEALADLPRERMAHSWDTEAIQKIEGSRVLVVGGGQSAAESVDCLRRRSNRVTWALRHSPEFFSEPLRLPTPLFKLVLRCSALLYRLPGPLLTLVSRMIFKTTITPTMRPAWDDPEVVKELAAAEELGLEPTADGAIRSRRLHRAFDHVVAATGFRFSLAGLPFLAPGVARGLELGEGFPPLDRSFQTRVPNLFLAGGIAEGTFGPAQRFIMGSWPAAHQIAEALEARLGGHSSNPARPAPEVSLNTG